MLDGYPVSNMVRVAISPYYGSSNYIVQSLDKGEIENDFNESREVMDGTAAPYYKCTVSAYNYGAWNTIDVFKIDEYSVWGKTYESDVIPTGVW